VNGIPLHSELLFLRNLICVEDGLDVIVLYQPLGTPQPNTERCTCRLDCKAATDIWEEETAMTKDVFDVNTCGYVKKASAPKANARKTNTHQELRDNYRPCVIIVERPSVSHATT